MLVPIKPIKPCEKWDTTGLGGPYINFDVGEEIHVSLRCAALMNQLGYVESSGSLVIEVAAPPVIETLAEPVIETAEPPVVAKILYDARDSQQKLRKRAAEISDKKYADLKKDDAIEIIKNAGEWREDAE